MIVILLEAHEIGLDVAELWEVALWAACVVGFSGWMIADGSPISRATYPTLFTLIGTTFGAGDGSTTFNVPDKTGRVSAMKEASGTRLTTAGSGVDGGTMGANGGSQNQSVL